MSSSNAPLRLGILGRNIVFVLGRNLLVIPIGFITIFVLARTLSPDDFGRYNLALFLPLLISTFLNLGVAPANIYLIGRDPSQLRAAIRSNLLLWVSVSLAGILIAAGTITGFASIFFPDVDPFFLWLALLSFPVTLLYNYWLSIIRGLQNFRDFNLATILTPSLFLGLLLLECAPIGGGIAGALVAYAISQLVGLLFVWLRIARTLRATPTADVDKATMLYTKEALHYGWKANLSNIITFLNYRADILLINLLLGTGAVGLYFTAARFTELLWVPANAVAVVLLPRIAELHSSQEENRAKITPLVMRWTFFITMILGVLIVLAGSPIFSLLGTEYAGAYPILLILLPGIVLITISKVLANDIAARGHPGLNVYTALSTFVIEITLILLLAGPLQLPGVALASSIAYSSQAFVSLALYLRLARVPLRAVLLPNELDGRIIAQTLRRLRR